MPTRKVVCGALSCWNSISVCSKSSWNACFMNSLVILWQDIPVALSSCIYSVVANTPLFCWIWNTKKVMLLVVICTQTLVLEELPSEFVMLMWQCRRRWGWREIHFGKVSVPKVSITFTFEIYVPSVQHEHTRQDLPRHRFEQRRIVWCFRIVERRIGNKMVCKKI